MVGLGDLKDQGNVCLETFRKCGAIAFRSLSAMKAKDAKLSLHHLGSDHTEKTLHAFLLGFRLASYQFEDHISKKSSVPFHSLLLTLPSSSKDTKLTTLTHTIEQASHICEGITFARWLADHPGNVIHPVNLAKEVQKKFKGTSVKVTVWDKNRIKKERMGLLYGVGQGSSVDPRLIIMEYKGKGIKKGKAPVWFCG